MFKNLALLVISIKKLKNKFYDYYDITKDSKLVFFYIEIYF